jgi:hypothetical protein
VSQLEKLEYWQAVKLNKIELRRLIPEFGANYFAYRKQNFFSIPIKYFSLQKI